MKYTKFERNQIIYNIFQYHEFLLNKQRYIYLNENKH